jgi:hypothetical protein
MKVAKLLSAIAMALLSSMPAWAQQQTADPELIVRLEEMLSKTDWQTRAGGGPKGVLLLHQAKLRRIIDQLKSGRSVTPKEIDALFLEHPC